MQFGNRKLAKRYKTEIFHPFINLYCSIWTIKKIVLVYLPICIKLWDRKK